MQNSYYEIKKKIVESGESKIFNNWHEHTGISMEDFLEGLKWVCDDPMKVYTMDDGSTVERMTREITVKDSKIRKLRRIHDDHGNFIAFIDYTDNSQSGFRVDVKVGINIKDRI